MADSFDPVFRGDYLFCLRNLSNELERRARGRESGWFADKSFRITEAFIAGILRALTFDEFAERFSLRFLPENPEYDRDARIAYEIYAPR